LAHAKCFKFGEEVAPRSMTMFNKQWLLWWGQK